MQTLSNFRGLAPSNSLDRYVDDFFNSRFRRMLGRPEMSSEDMTTPAVNIQEMEGRGYQINVAAPGFDKSDFDIDVKENILHISAEREVKNEKSDNFTRREYNYAHFRRSFTLPENAEEDKIEASYQNGILEIQVPVEQEKTKPELRRKIDIQ